MAGYSGTPLARKLGVKSESRVLLGRAPAGFTVDGLPAAAVVHRRASGGGYDVIVGFCSDHRTLDGAFEGWRSRLAPAGGLWIAWPKRSSGTATDLDDGAVREFGLAAGLVDNKVCAIDSTWSALRFVVRVADRTR
ncbi:DUF3052 domain-containing protein [Nocardia sp. alder85J]|uniref:DUF3052 domain-containing protein n=1 Tax=Nocardia sp. alder85J TaxID=2862949 RepID=UPI001CD6BA97|nr:DUF3052 domain-containing protein [Nocardia sp. alder85J]MCX4099058.1 DUF3052 domain-containing protein [Nocardia sp. alder85J]